MNTDIVNQMVFKKYASKNWRKNFKEKYERKKVETFHLRKMKKIIMTRTKKYI